ncbi:hypothetical protein ACFLRM_01155 [Acidobacteriota bacterium]
MKRITVTFLMVLFLGFFLMNGLTADSRDDIQSIKKAVKKNAAYKAGSEVKWFKVLVTDNVTKKDKVKITLPISVVDLLVKSSHNHDLKIDRDDCDIDLKELLAELKDLGPMVLIEVYEEDETVKVWLE